MEVSITLPDREKPIMYSLEHRPNSGEAILIELPNERFFIKVDMVVHEDRTKFLVLLCDYCPIKRYKLYP